MKTNDTIKNLAALLGFIFLKVLLQYIALSDGFDLHRDEYLYLDQARHPAWGFTSVPPFTSWVSYLILLLGNSVYWVKFFPALFGVLTLILVWKSVEALGGNIFARSLAATAFIFSIVLRINTLYQPNSADIFFWMLVFYCLIRYIGTEKPVWLYGMALGFALGFFNKYNICFLLAGLLAGMIFTRYRSLYKKPAFYMAAGVAILVILPNIVWQFRNGLPVVGHMGELTSSQLVHIDRVSFLIEQATFFFPGLFILLAAFAGFLFHKPFQNYRVVGWCFLFVICFYLLFRGKPYYAIGLYPVLLAFGAVYTERLSATGSVLSYYFRIISFGVIVGLGILLMIVSTPMFPPEKIMRDETLKRVYNASGQLVWEDGKTYVVPQDYSDMTGWKELAAKVDSAYRLLSPEEQQNTLVFCDNYGQAGAINYYITPTPGAISFHADYKNWLPAEDKNFTALILVYHAGHFNDREEQTFPHLPFEKARYIGRVEYPVAREKGTNIYLLTNPTAPFTGADIRKFAQTTSTPPPWSSHLGEDFKNFIFIRI